MPTVPHIKGRLPGPRARAILEKAAVYMPKGKVLPTLYRVLAHAENALLTDVDGNIFIDLLSGAGVNLVGNRNPDVQAAIQAQMNKVWHTSSGAGLHEPYVDLAASVVEFMGGGGRKAAFFTVGAEGVENAIRYAQVFTKRKEIISFNNCFHGRSHLALSLTGNSTYKVGVGPFCSNVHRLPFPDCYRCPLGHSRENCGVACANLLDTVGHYEVPTDHIAAVIIEAIQGAGGVVPVPPEFMQAVRRFCDDNGIVLIVDEIQTGFGRTGKKFAIDHCGVEADLYPIAKAFGGGMTIAGIVGRADILDAMPSSGVGGTYAGHPLGCAAGIAGIKVIEEQKLVERARWLGEIANEVLEPLMQRCPLVGDLRIWGALIGIDLVSDRKSRKPATDAAIKVATEAGQRGVVVGRGHHFGHVIRLLPPVTIPEDQFRAALNILSEVIEEVAAD